MNARGNRLYKRALLVLALLFLAGLVPIQRSLNRQRADPALGFMRVTDLGSNAPPVLAFTTVALGGFRGLIANALWVRANDLQNDGQYFEMVQLADWITKLQPTFVQVWLVQAWNMAYNISVKFSDPADRWRWVLRGIELLRDQGLRVNPHEALIYRELAWFFQHKMGANLDDAHLFYKAEWARQMQAVLGGGRPDYGALLNPQTPEARQRVRTLKEQYRMDPAVMKEVDERFGPLEWRLPEAHAIYWASVGLKYCKPKDLITLRRAIYSSMLASLRHGRIITLEPFYIGPDLEMAARVYQTYEQLLVEEKESTYTIQQAQRSFLRELIFLLYSYNRIPEANRWFGLLREKYPDQFPPETTLDDYALERMTKEVATLTADQMKIVLNGILYQHYQALALDEDDRAEGFDRMVRHLWSFYDNRIANRRDPLKFPPLDEMKRLALNDLLDPQRGLLTPEMMLRLRTRLNLPAPASGSNTNAPAARP